MVMVDVMMVVVVVVVWSTRVVCGRVADGLDDGC